MFRQVIMTGIAVISRAFISAYQLALQNAKAGGVKPIRRGTMMHPDEALKVLNIEKSNMNKKAIEEQYNKFFDLNDPKKGGSFYLQSKIFRAKETLDRQLALKRKRELEKEQKKISNQM